MRFLNSKLNITNFNLFVIMHLVSQIVRAANPTIREGLTARVHLPAAVLFTVSALYSEISQIISLDSP